jgi:hypothetical protein
MNSMRFRAGDKTLAPGCARARMLESGESSRRSDTSMLRRTRVDGRVRLWIHSRWSDRVPAALRGGLLGKLPFRIVGSKFQGMPHLTADLLRSDVMYVSSSNKKTPRSTHFARGSDSFAALVIRSAGLGGRVGRRLLHATPDRAKSAADIYAGPQDDLIPPGWTGFALGLLDDPAALLAGVVLFPDPPISGPKTVIQ